jgi:hypothetical protein
VNPLGKRRIKAASEHLLDPQHRPLPFRLNLSAEAASPLLVKRLCRSAVAL